MNYSNAEDFLNTHFPPKSKQIKPKMYSFDEVRELLKEREKEVIEEIEKELKSQKVPASYEKAHYKMGLERAIEIIKKL